MASKRGERRREGGGGKTGRETGRAPGHRRRRRRRRPLTPRCGCWAAPGRAERGQPGAGPGPCAPRSGPARRGGGGGSAGAAARGGRRPPYHSSSKAGAAAFPARVPPPLPFLLSSSSAPPLPAPPLFFFFWGGGATPTPCTLTPGRCAPLAFCSLTAALIGFSAALGSPVLPRGQRCPGGGWGWRGGGGN